jgi:hypothetical protein
MQAPLYNMLMVVRLSDGVSWNLVGALSPVRLDWGYALGITCEEIFTQVAFPDQFVTIIRIRLDSLGPGTQPD